MADDDQEDGLTLDAKVANWIETTGAPVEMRAARALIEAGLDVEQSQYYTDPASGQPREVDLVAGLEQRSSTGQRLVVQAIVECKYAVSPWVLFRPPAEHSTSMNRINERITTHYGAEWLKAASQDRRLRWDGIWDSDTQPGYSLRTSHPTSTGDPAKRRDEGKDFAYEALTTVTKATDSIARTLNDSPDDVVLGVLFPVIMICGILFEARLDEDELKTRRIDWGQVWWNRPEGLPRVLVDVVTEDALLRYARYFEHSAVMLLTDGRPAAESVNTTGVW